jgi:septal ring factor EnvC (AmiA/AmiB activator)
MQPARNNPHLHGIARADALSLARISVILFSATLASAGVSASAQVAENAPQAAGSPDAIKQREQELEATRAQQKSSTELQQQLKASIAAIGQDRSKLNTQLIDVAAQVRTVETRIGDAEARLRPLDARDQQIRSSLDSRRAEVVEVLAALQRAGRRTPPALLVRPEDALQSSPKTSPNSWPCARRLPRNATAWPPTVTT